MDETTRLAVKLVLLAFGLLVGIFATLRRARFRAGRRRVKREIRNAWQKTHPGELYPECPVCRLPYPQSIPDCPFCQRSRIRARALRRDDDWAIETAHGYGGVGTGLGGAAPD